MDAGPESPRDDEEQYVFDGDNPGSPDSYTPDDPDAPSHPRAGADCKDEDPPEEESKELNDENEPVDSQPEKKPNWGVRRAVKGNDEEEAILRLAALQVEEERATDPAILAQIELIEKSTPTTDLEIAFSETIKRRETHLARLTSEILKLKKFISKRKQTYKRKRKDDGAPTRALSAYNIFIQDRFARLAKENENALKSENENATMKRVPPASLVAATGNAWKTLSAEVKQQYEER